MAMGAGAFRTEAGEETRRRAILYGSVALAFAAGLVIVLELVAGFSQLGWGRYVGTDYQIYMDAARRWLDGGSYFLPRQLGGSYDIQSGDVLYPPVALWLFVPFTMLPPVVWWITPVGITPSPCGTYGPQPGRSRSQPLRPRLHATRFPHLLTLAQ